jgi:hypothetical protein
MFIRPHVLLDPNSPTGPAISNGAPATPATPATPLPDGIHQLIPHTIGAPETPATPEAPQLTPEQIAQQQRDQQFEALLQQNQQMMQLLMSQQRPQGPAAQPAPQPLQPFTLDGIPDPVAAPKDFTAQLTQRIQQREQQLGQFLTHNITQQISRGAAMDSVFNRFQIQHSDLAKRSALLQGAAITEFQALQQQGIDPVAVAQQNPDSLVARIAARMQQELGIAAQPSSQPNASRATGLSSGSGAPASPRTAPAPLGFVEQLNKARRESGLI